MKSYFYSPTIFNGGGGYSFTADRAYVRPVRSVHPVRPLRNSNGFRAISFENIGVLN